jgi:hypothetical protein
MGDNLEKFRLIPHTISLRHLKGMKGPQGSFEEEFAAYQLVGGVIDHQGYDG